MSSFAGGIHPLFERMYLLALFRSFAFSLAKWHFLNILPRLLIASSASCLYSSEEEPSNASLICSNPKSIALTSFSVIDICILFLLSTYPAGFLTAGAGNLLYSDCFFRIRVLCNPIDCDFHGAVSILIASSSPDSARFLNSIYHDNEV